MTAPQGERPYWWFTGETVRILTEQLHAAGPDARLEVRPKGDHCWLHVIPAAHTAETAKAAGFSPLNLSHVCPPDCP